MSEKQQQRRQSRIVALKALFYYLEADEKRKPDECFQYVLMDIEARPSDDFGDTIFTTTIENLKKIKVLLRAFAPEFPFDKITPINRALLCLGFSEMKFIGTPPIVVINEYIELSKEFGETKSASFINGVLDHYRKSLGLETQKK